MGGGGTLVRKLRCCSIRSTGNKFLTSVHNTGNKVPKTFDFLCIGMSIQPLDFDRPISVVSVASGERCDKINGCY
mgnify:CR=1 FL=1